MRDIEHNERIITFKTDRVTIESEKEIPWTLDGEFGGKHTKVKISNKHQAIQIMVNEKKSQEKRESAKQTAETAQEGEMKKTEPEKIENGNSFFRQNEL